MRATGWTRTELLQWEGGVTPLASRVGQLTAGWVAKSLKAGGSTGGRLRDILDHGPNVLGRRRRKAWQVKAATATRSLLGRSTLLRCTPDQDAEGYREPPPWEDDLAAIRIQD